MTISSIMDSFAGGTTMHGIPKAIRSNSRTGRLFWVIACLGALSICSMQFVQLLTKYYSYPKKVTIDVVTSNVPFPDISLCNMRNLDSMVLNDLNTIFKIISEHYSNSSTLPWDHNGWTFNVSSFNETVNVSRPFVKAYMSYLAKYYPLKRYGSFEVINIVNAVLTRTTIATNIDKELVKQAGIPFDEFIVTCRLGSSDCNRTSDFKQFFDPYYYNCFTYHATEVGKTESMLAEGLENGWSTVVLTGSGMLDKNDNIRIIPGTHERLSPQSSNEGVRVVIHPPHTEPFPHTEGFDVPPGHSVSFGLKPAETIRIGPPHGNCTNMNAYRLISCQKECLQRGVVKQCGCKDIHLPGHDLYPSVRFCSDDKHLVPDSCRHASIDGFPKNECVEALYNFHNKLTCARNAILGMSKNASHAATCRCYPPCYELSYDVTYSLSRWPAESFDGEEAYIDIFEVEDYPSRIELLGDQDKLNTYAAYFGEGNRRESMHDFARLNVYIADSNVIKTEESEDYQQSQLLSDIGGQLGLWVGISVITLAEILELCIDVLFHVKKQWDKSHTKQPKTPPPPVDTSNLNDKKCARTYYTCHCRDIKNGSIPMLPIDTQV